MADLTIPDYSDAGGIDASADLFLIWQNSTNTYRKITRNVILGSTGTPVTTTASQTLQNKTLDNTNSLTILDNALTIQDNVDPTKQAQFQLSSITAGQTRVLTVPDTNLTIVGTATTQTLTNKTLTSPVITGGSIAGTTVTTDAIVGQTDADTGTIYGVTITNGVIASAGLLNTVNTAALQNLAVTNAKIANDTITGAKIDWSATGADAGIWWEELGRTTLSVAGDTITVNNIPARKFLMVVVSAVPTGGTISAALQFNADTGSNYALRQSTDGAADTTATSQASINTMANGALAAPTMVTANITNISAQEKILYATSTTQGTAGAGNAPNRRETAGKWVNTSAQISRIDCINVGTGDYAAGSQVIVLGHD